MILLDANILLYAYNPSFPQHQVARGWFTQTLSTPEVVGLPWATILAFVRISTNPRAFPQPLAIAEATTIVSDWLAHPTVAVVSPGDRHWEILERLLLALQVRGPEVSDAHLAALAIEHGAALCTTDRRFSAYEGLRTINPLEPAV